MAKIRNVHRGVSEQLHHAYGSYDLLNQKFAKRFGQFTGEELVRLMRVLAIIVFARASQMSAAVEKEQSALLQRAIDVAGELEVSYFGTEWRLDSFTKKVA